MRTAEDARRDPRPGDVFIIGPQWQQERYEVEKNVGGVIQYVMGESARLCCLATEWRNWAATAEVLKVANP